MRPFQEGESFYHLITRAIPSFLESDYPLFIEFVTSYVTFLEQPRVLGVKTVVPNYGSANGATETVSLGGPLYEARKFLDYRDIDTTLDEFRSHFLAMFAKNFPQYQFVSPELLVRALRQFYNAKGTEDSLSWLFRVVFNESAEVYFPRTDVLRASDGTWVAPITLKVSTPVDGQTNDAINRLYIGQRIQTDTGSAQVESVVTNIVGQAYNQNIIVNELTLKADTILGTFSPGQSVINIDSDDTVTTVILSVITGVTVQDGGSNYAVGDTVLVSEGPAGGGGYQAVGAVAQVSNTAINGVTVINGGDGFLVGLPVTFVSTSGSGATGVIQSITTGNFLLEDGSGSFVLEQQQAGDTNYFTLEDRNVLFLELIIDPFVNATATVTIDSADYGVATGVTQLNGATIDSSIELALVATDEKPFMHPWVFTNVLETTAELANAAAVLTVVGNTQFSNGASVFSIPTLQSLANSSTANVTANVIVSDITTSTLYLKEFTGFHKFNTNMVLKQNGSGVLQSGTVTTDGTANVVGVSTTFTQLVPNTHIRFGDGTHAVVRSIVNNTFLTTFAAVGVTLAANTWSIVPVGTVTTITFLAQRYYGKIKSIQLLTNGSGYKTPPAVIADSISGRAQEKFHLVPSPANPVDPESADNTIVSSGTQVDVFADATLQVRQDTGQIQKVAMLNTGVSYQDANSIQLTAVHGNNRNGSDAAMTAVLGAETTYPGVFTTNRGFLSSNKYLQDADFYNDYTYVVRVTESFDRYRDILKKLLHPAGFKALGEVVYVPEASENVADSDFSISQVLV